METRANFVLIGVFTLAVIAGAFLFVLWFSGLTRISQHKTYEVLFTGSVSGLSRGSAVLFNGLRVGEVTQIGLDPENPKRVQVLIDASGDAPIRQDTKARLEIQGLTGAAVVALTGGAPDSPILVGRNGEPPRLIAEPSQLQDIMENVRAVSAEAQSVLGKIDKLVSDNSATVGDAIHNIDAFSKALADNSAGVNSALAGLSDLGRKVGPLSDKLQALSEHLDKLVQAVDPEAVRRVVGDVQSVADTIAGRKEAIDSLLGDAASLAKHLNESAGRLDTAVSDFDGLVKAVDTKKIANFVNGADALGQVVTANRANIDSTLRDASELAAKLNKSADKIDALMASLQSFVGSPDLKGPLGEVGDAARSVRKLADDLNTRTKEISVGLTHFTSTGLREYEALAIDGRRAINDFDSVVRSFQRNPNQVIFGAKPALPEYHGEP